MNDDELTELLRATLREQADRAPGSEGLADRMLARIAGVETLGGEPAAADVVELHRRRAHRNRWEGGRITAIFAAVASVAAVVTLSIVVAKHSGSSDSSAGKAAPQYGAGTEGRSAAAPSATIAAGSGATLRAAAPTAAATPVPAGFTVTDLTYYTFGAGYALGNATCAVAPTTKSARGTTSGPTSVCGALVRTAGTGGDLSWSLASASLPFGVGATTGAPVDHLRFFSRAVGYAYGAGGVYATVDAGVSWTKQLVSADALEVADGVVVAVNHPTSCGAGQSCTYTVRVADTATDDWAPVTLPGGPVVGTGVELARTGDNVYLVARTATGADERFFASADDGRTWTQRSKDLCPTEKNGSQSSALALASAAAGSPMAVSVLCTSSSGTFLRTSIDAGVSFAVGKENLTAVRALVMISPKATLLSADQLYRSVNTGDSYSPVVSGPNPIRGTPRFLGFENASLGRWVSPDGSAVWTTTDAGATWTKYTFG
jgi:hypothetical protein